MKRIALKKVLDINVLERVDGRTNAGFLRISSDEHPALVGDLEQCCIAWLQLLALPQLAIVARILVSHNHRFVQLEYGFISFCLLLQDLFKKPQ